VPHVKRQVAPDSGIPATVSLGRTPRAAALTLSPQPTSAVPPVALLPTDPAYLIASGWDGPLRPAGLPAASAMLDTLEREYVRHEAADWARCGPVWDCGRTAGYDAPYTRYQQWLRTADPALWHHATAGAANYLRAYLAPALRGGTGAAPWWSNTEGLRVAYWATGWDSLRVAVRRQAELMAWFVRPGSQLSMGTAGGDDRMKAKAILAALDAHALDASSPLPGHAATQYTRWLADTTLAGWVTGVLGAQQVGGARPGAFGGTYYAGGQKNFMVGMLLAALIRYHDEVAPDPRIPAAVERNTRYAWAADWDPVKRGFKYVSVDSTGEYPTGQAGAEPGLNGLTVPAFAWLSSRATDPARRDTLARQVDEQLRGLYAAERTWWAASGKAFDQGFYRHFNVAAWMATPPAPLPTSTRRD
jgi:hypothetical protein